VDAAAKAIHREPWNQAKIVGHWTPFKLRVIWAIPVRMQIGKPGTGVHCSICRDRQQTQNAGVAVPITGSMASPIKGPAILTAARATDLIAGKWYMKLHTAANPNGEVRGQVTVQP
jgi:hypothetical protein